MKHWMIVAAAASLSSAGAAFAQSADDDFLDALFADEPAAEPESRGEAVAPRADVQTAAPPPPEALSTIAVEPLQTPVAQPAAAPPPRATQIEEIVVTAQKKEQSLQDVPISVTAVDGAFIQMTNAVDLAEVAAYVPNVRVDADDLGSPQLFIRGFGTNAFNPSFESSVGFVQDEIYFGRPGYFTESMFDVDRVEVLRGPQGTLFGKNTIAGVFNVTSKRPGNFFEADGRYSYGSDNAHRVEGGAGGMFSDWGGLRVAGLYRSEDGELYNGFLDREEEKLTQKAGRLKLLLYPLPNVTSELTAQISDTEAAFWPFQLMQLDDDTRNFLESYDPGIEDDPYDFNTSADTPGFIEKGSETVALNTRWDLGTVAGGLHDSSLTLVLAGSTFHIDQLNELDVSPADIARLDNHEDHEQISAELRFAARADSLFGLGREIDFVAGAFWYESSYTLLARIMAGSDIGAYLLTDDFLQLASGGGINLFGPIGLPGIPLIGNLLGPVIGEDFYQLDYEQDVSSLAFFGQATWFLTERWAITPGIRINREEKTVDSLGTRQCTLDRLGLPICVMSLLLGAENYEQRGLERDESDVSPKFVIQYFGDSGVNLYASYARGYKSGGYNSLSFTGEDLEFEPENAETFELGIKATLLDRSLRVNATVYETRFDNLQVLAFNGIFFDVSNAASAKSRGLEADFLWLTPFAPLQIMGSVGLLDAKYEDYAAAPAPVRNPQTGELQLDAQQDLGGRTIAFAPKATATLTPMLTFPVFGLTGRLAGDVLYQGEQYTDTDLDPASRVDAYTRYSARFTLSDVMERWSVTIGANNLTDKRVLNQVTDATFFPGTYFAQQASGRQLYAAVTLRFGS
ncbi:MAG: TonB-dependent receptor [Sinimarinibacterium flocculans]|uniref:TonB-dependent receptor n=1 Tax=Sinimarinibacterium flocculans TaxID=985250 RepID=UPI003C5D8C68